MANDNQEIIVTVGAELDTTNLDKQLKELKNNDTITIQVPANIKLKEFETQVNEIYKYVEKKELDNVDIDIEFDSETAAKKLEGLEKRIEKISDKAKSSPVTINLTSNIDDVIKEIDTKLDNAIVDKKEIEIEVTYKEKENASSFKETRRNEERITDNRDDYESDSYEGRNVNDDYVRNELREMERNKGERFDSTGMVNVNGIWTPRSVVERERREAEQRKNPQPVSKTPTNTPDVENKVENLNNQIDGILAAIQADIDSIKNLAGDTDEFKQGLKKVDAQRNEAKRLVNQLPENDRAKYDTNFQDIQSQINSAGLYGKDAAKYYVDNLRNVSSEIDKFMAKGGEYHQLINNKDYEAAYKRAEDLYNQYDVGYSNVDKHIKGLKDSDKPTIQADFDKIEADTESFRDAFDKLERWNDAKDEGAKAQKKIEKEINAELKNRYKEGEKAQKQEIKNAEDKKKKQKEQQNANKTSVKDSKQTLKDTEKETSLKYKCSKDMSKNAQAEWERAAKNLAAQKKLNELNQQNAQTDEERAKIQEQINRATVEANRVVRNKDPKAYLEEGMKLINEGRGDEVEIPQEIVDRINEQIEGKKQVKELTGEIAEKEQEVVTATEESSKADGDRQLTLDDINNDLDDQTEKTEKITQNIEDEENAEKGVVNEVENKNDALEESADASNNAADSANKETNAHKEGADAVGDKVDTQEQGGNISEQTADNARNEADAVENTQDAIENTNVDRQEGLEITNQTDDAQRNITEETQNTADVQDNVSDNVDEITDNLHEQVNAEERVTDAVNDQEDATRTVANLGDDIVDDTEEQLAAQNNLNNAADEELTTEQQITNENEKQRQVAKQALQEIQALQESISNHLQEISDYNADDKNIVKRNPLQEIDVDKVEDDIIRIQQQIISLGDAVGIPLELFVQVKQQIQETGHAIERDLVESTEGAYHASNKLVDANEQFNNSLLQSEDRLKNIDNIEKETLGRIDKLCTQYKALYREQVNINNTNKVNQEELTKQLDIIDREIQKERQSLTLSESQNKAEQKYNDLLQANTAELDKQIRKARQKNDIESQDRLNTARNELDIRRSGSGGGGNGGGSGGGGGGGGNPPDRELQALITINRILSESIQLYKERHDLMIKNLQGKTTTEDLAQIKALQERERAIELLILSEKQYIVTAERTQILNDILANADKERATADAKLAAEEQKVADAFRARQEAQEKAAQQKQIQQDDDNALSDLQKMIDEYNQLAQKRAQLSADGILGRNVSVELQDTIDKMQRLESQMGHLTGFISDTKKQEQAQRLLNKAIEDSVQLAEKARVAATTQKTAKTDDALLKGLVKVNQQYQALSEERAKLKAEGLFGNNTTQQVNDLTTKIEKLEQGMQKIVNRVQDTKKHDKAQQQLNNTLEKTKVLSEQIEKQTKNATANDILKKLNKDYQERIVKLREIVALERDVNISVKDRQAYVGKARERLAELDEEIEKLEQLIQANNDLAAAQEKLNDMQNGANEDLIDGLDQVQSETEGTTSALQNMMDAFGDVMDRFINWDMAYNIINGLQQVASTAIQTASELDRVLTDLQIVTGQTRAHTEELLMSYNGLARQLGVTTQSVAEAGNEFLRQGLSVEDTNKMIAASQHLSVLGMIESQEASQYLTSATKGYGLAANEAMSIVDKLTKVDLSAAVSSGYLAEAMARTTSSAKLAGVSMDKLISYIAVVGETTQKSAATVGESFKTLFARFGNIKAGVFESMEEDMENLNDIEGAFGRIGIAIRDTGGEMREVDVVLDELAGKWDELSTLEKNGVAIAAAGVRQRENFLVLMDNYNKSLALEAQSLNAAGTATEKYKAYSESLAASLQKIPVIFEEIVLKSNLAKVLKGFVDFGATVLKIAGDLRLLNVALGLVAAAFSTRLITAIGASIARFGAMRKELSAIRTAVTALNPAYQQLGNSLVRNVQAAANVNRVFTQYAGTLTNVSARQKAVIISTLAQKGAFVGLTEAQIQAKLMTLGLTEADAANAAAKLVQARATEAQLAATVKLTAAQLGLNIAMMANPIFWIITGVVTLLTLLPSLISGVETGAQKFDALNDELNETIGKITETESEVKSLENTIKDLTELKASGEISAAQERELELAIQQKKVAEERLKIEQDIAEAIRSQMAEYSMDKAVDTFNEYIDGMMDWKQDFGQFMTALGTQFTNELNMIAGNMEAIQPVLWGTKEIAQETFRMWGIVEAQAQNDKSFIYRSEGLRQFRERYTAWQTEKQKLDKLQADHYKAVTEEEKAAIQSLINEQQILVDNAYNSWQQILAFASKMVEALPDEGFAEIKEYLNGLLEAVQSTALTTEDIISEIMESTDEGVKAVLEEIRTEIEETGTVTSENMQGLLDKIQELNTEGSALSEIFAANADAMEIAGITENEILEQIVLNLIAAQDETNNLATSTENFKEALESNPLQFYYEGLVKIEEQYQLLADAQDEFRESGQLANETILNLINAGLQDWLPYVTDETWNVTEATDQMAMDLFDAAEAAVYEKLCAELDAIAMEELTGAAVNAGNANETAGGQMEAAGNKAANAAGKVTNLGNAAATAAPKIRALGDAWNYFLGAYSKGGGTGVMSSQAQEKAQNAIKQAQTAIDLITKARENLTKLNSSGGGSSGGGGGGSRPYSTSRPSSGSGGGGSGSGGGGGSSDKTGSQTDEWKAAYDRQLKDLQFMRDTDLINEKEYIDKLEALNNQYFKGRAEYAEEYAENVKTIYQARKKFLEEQRKEEEDALKKQLDEDKKALKEKLDADKKALKDKYDAEKKMLQDRKKNEVKALQETAKAAKEANKAQQKALKDQLDAYKEIINTRKKLLDSYDDERSFTNGLEEINKDIAKMENKLAEVRLDTSQEGQQKRLELEDELANRIKDKEDFIYDHSVETQKDALDQEYEQYEKYVDDSLEKLEEALDKIEDDLDKNVEAIETAIDNMLDKLEQDYDTNLEALEKQYETTLNNLEAQFEAGMKAIETSFDSAVKALQDGVRELGISFETLSGQIQETMDKAAQAAAQSDSSGGGGSSGGSGGSSGGGSSLKKSETKKEEKTIHPQYGELVSTSVTGNTYKDEKGGYTWVSHDGNKRTYTQPKNNGKTTSKYGELISTSAAGNVYKDEKGGTTFISHDGNTRTYTQPKKHHKGLDTGFVGGVKGNEEFAKLLKGELVINPKQQNRFMDSILPKLMQAKGEKVQPNMDNNFVMNLNVEGNLDEKTLPKIEDAVKKLINTYFIRGQRRSANSFSI